MCDGGFFCTKKEIMKYSKLFGKTVRTAQRDMQFASHKLLYRAGFVRESTAGRYFFLPLGMRVKAKIMNIVREEMNARGAQEMLAPTLHPLSLWEETNRDQAAGFELMQVTDRRDAQFALGGTAEEMFVDVVRKFQLSYKDLPFNIYQFSEKFRDEFRARGGLLRVREFTMKDAYSFDTDADAFQKTYDDMAAAYEVIIKKIGLTPTKVAADGGYIGGDYCHEYVVECGVGESRFLTTDDGTYCAHEDIATFKKEDKNIDEPQQELTQVQVERGTTMEDGVQAHNLPLWQQIKDVLYKNEKGEYILAVIRGDLDVNETKLQNISGAHQLEMATDEEVRADLGSEPGFISPVGIAERLADGVKLTIIADDSLRGVVNAYGGDNALHQDLLNINIDRDWSADIEEDIAMAQAGFITADGKELIEKRGAEVGNIFQLGHHYTSRMQNATFINQDGAQQEYYMGCYGFGIGRALATVVELHHDDAGIVWPESIAPFQVHLISLKGGEEKAQRLYDQLTAAHVEVLWDERNCGAGQKFADADLIGNPLRFVVSERTGNSVEVKKRTEADTSMLSIEEAIELARSIQ